MLGGHAQLGARPKEGLHQGYGQAQHEEGCHEEVPGGDQVLQELRSMALKDEDASIPGIWNGLW